MSLPMDVLIPQETGERMDHGLQTNIPDKCVTCFTCTKM